MIVTKKEEVILYGKTVCPKCMFAENELNVNEITYIKKNIDTDEEAKEKLIDLGLMGLPVLEVNGEITSNYTEIMKKISTL